MREYVILETRHELPSVYDASSGTLVRGDAHSGHVLLMLTPRSKVIGLRELLASEQIRPNFNS